MSNIYANTDPEADPSPSYGRLRDAYDAYYVSGAEPMEVAGKAGDGKPILLNTDGN